MCLAAYHASHVGGARTRYLDNEQFLTAAVNNPDGIGILWAKGGRLRLAKFLDADDRAWQCYRSVQELGVPMAVHFRLATHGDRDYMNCHPFLVGDNIGMIHNGILSQVRAKEGVSDTYAFARVLSKWREDFFDNKAAWRMVEMASYGSKLVFLRSDGQVRIAHSSSGHWRDGSWYSNTSYKEWNGFSTVYQAGWDVAEGKVVTTPITYENSTLAKARGVWHRGEPFCFTCAEVVAGSVGKAAGGEIYPMDREICSRCNLML